MEPHGERGVRVVLKAPPDETTRGSEQVVGVAAATSEDRAVVVDPQKEIRKRMHHRTHVRVRLEQLLRAEVEGALQQRPVGVRLPVGVADRREEAVQFRGPWFHGTEEGMDLASQQAMEFGHRQAASASVVIVIVWLWSSQRALGVNGEISP